MDEDLRNDLLACETDVEGVLNRLNNDEELYISLLQNFMEDTTMQDLDLAVREQRWDDAFTAAHALKGLAGNMGFTSLLYVTGEIVLIIRTGRVDEIDAALRTVWYYYKEIVSIIHQAMERSGEADK